MLKKVFISIVVLLAVAYLAVAMTTFNRAPADAVCSGVEFRFDTVGQQDAGFITQEGLKRLLQAHKLYPQGKKMDSIRCRDMEACLEKSRSSGVPNVTRHLLVVSVWRSCRACLCYALWQTMVSSFIWIRRMRLSPVQAMWSIYPWLQGPLRGRRHPGCCMT